MLSTEEKENVEKETLELAEKFSKATEGDLAWKLVRKWKNYHHASPEDFDTFVELVAKRFNRPLADLQNDVDFAWEKAETADEESIFSQALLLATKNPIPPEMIGGRVSDQFRFAASIIYYLSILKKGDPFHVAAPKMAKVLGFSSDNKGDGVRKILARMQMRNLIKCVDPRYEVGAKSKLYVWTGGKLATIEHEIVF
jgi:hypothetical protein